MTLDHPLILPAAVSFIALVLIVLLWLRLRPAQLECKEPLFNPEFRAFLGQLDIAVRSHLIIFPAMPVNDVLQGKGGGKALLRKFRNERFDFVVCHRRNMDVLCVIKLGGNNASNEKYRTLCQSAGLTLLEYDIKPYRDVPSLRQEVLGACGIDEFELPIIQPGEQLQEEKMKRKRKQLHHRPARSVSPLWFLKPSTKVPTLARNAGSAPDIQAVKEQNLNSTPVKYALTKQGLNSC